MKINANGRYLKKKEKETFILKISIAKTCRRVAVSFDDLQYRRELNAHSKAINRSST